MSFEMFTFDGLRKPAKGSKKVCGCRVEMTTRYGKKVASPFAPTGPWTPRAEVAGQPMVVCNGIRRFVSRKDALKFLAAERAGGSFCVYTKKGKRCKAGKRRVGGRCVPQ
jgi:hypothetical protein